MSDPEGGPLNQRQIDQLVEAVRKGELPRDRDSLARITQAKSIDFRDPSWSRDRIIRRRLGVLDLVFNRLAPALQITMTKNLRFPIRASVAQVELQQFGDFIDGFENAGTLGPEVPSSGASGNSCSPPPMNHLPIRVGRGSCTFARGRSCLSVE